MNNIGVKPFDSLGKTFDPSFHQAVMQEESMRSILKTRLSKELQKGYMIHDRLLRPAMVVVSKKKTAPEESRKLDSEIKE